MSLSGKIVGISKGVTLLLLEQLGVTVNGSYTPFTPSTISVTEGTGAPRALLSTETGSFVDNSGTTVKAAVTLPSAAAGLRFVFRVTDTDGLRIVANTGDDIRIGDLTCATAGYFESVRVGSSVELVAINATTWQAIDGVLGTWRADSTTSSGFAFTPTPWTSWTPTSTFTNTTWTGAYRQVGQNLEMQIRGICTGTPAAATALRFTIPYGTIDRQPATQYVLDGSGFAWDATATTFYGPFLFVWETSTAFTLYHTNGTTSMAAVISSTATPFIWAINDECYVSVSVPLA